MPRKGKIKHFLTDEVQHIVTPPPPKPPEPLPEALPIFMRWTVTDRLSESRSTGKTSHFATLCFDGTGVYTLEGPEAKTKLKHQADQWNAQEYIPKLDVHPGYFKARPGKDAFIQWGKGGDRPFVT